MSDQEKPLCFDRADVGSDVVVSHTHDLAPDGYRHFWGVERFLSLLRDDIWAASLDMHEDDKETFRKALLLAADIAEKFAHQPEEGK